MAMISICLIIKILLCSPICEAICMSMDSIWESTHTEVRGCNMGMQMRLQKY